MNTNPTVVGFLYFSEDDTGSGSWSGNSGIRRVSGQGGRAPPAPTGAEGSSMRATLRIWAAGQDKEQVGFQTFLDQLTPVGWDAAGLFQPEHFDGFAGRSD